MDLGASRTVTTSYFRGAVIFRLTVARSCFGKFFVSKLLFLVFLHQDEPSPPRPEAYPIPTQTYPRDYFTIPASKSQDRVIGPGQGPAQHWQGMEDRERLPVVDNIHNSMQVRGAALILLSLLSVKRLSTCLCSAVFSPAGQPLPGRLVPTSRRNEARGSHATALPAGLPAPRTRVSTPRSGLPERSAR